MGVWPSGEVNECSSIAKDLHAKLDASSTFQMTLHNDLKSALNTTAHLLIQRADGV